MENRNNDLFEGLFSRLHEESLPEDFRLKMMNKIFAETRRIKKRNERFALLAVVVASVFMLSLVVVAFIYLDIGKINISLPSFSSLPFYIYIGILGFILLCIDHRFREIYKKKHSDKTSENRV